MKVLALAFVLLAVGAHAASIQADAPDQLAHVRSVMDMYLTQVKEGAKRSLGQLDDAEYGELKNRVIQRIDELYNQLKAVQASVAPVTDSVVSTIADVTLEFRTAVEADIEALKVDLEPKRAELQEVIDRHIADYRTRIEPIVTEYFAKHNADMEVLKTKLDPILADLQVKLTTNVEETKAALMPIVEAVRIKLSERLEQMKLMVSPYVDEYKEQLKNAYSKIQSINTDDADALRDKIRPLAEEIKVKMQAIYEAVYATITKSN
ncbi:apolipoprotein A-I-like [Sebastes umbrosus]|uniref:apolipoprotein A-I-like n=1 Tax=Sebastes umbrosus TaxID=72105 RepID=UPI00189F44D4|nr:apolipoprotein A-I-like [Sebastes umbrosus]XP_037632299.1 apolipoprotein A-I-like [Sebastes umbrosus]